MKIGIVNYGMGNIRSITSALNYLGIESVNYTSNYEVLNSADKLILPGVGNFSEAMRIIENNKLDKILQELVLLKEKPILGICLGMQLLAKSSTEGGYSKGLGFVDSFVDKFQESLLKIPHVGFNQVCINEENKMFRGFNHKKIDFYFTHSYKMTSSNNIGQSMCNYGSDFIASFEIKNIVGTQFHPELSQTNGLRLLENFLLHF